LKIDTVTVASDSYSEGEKIFGTNFRSSIISQKSKKASSSKNSAFEDCKEDMKDDWLIPVIVGSVLGGIVIVVVVAYVIGRRRQIEDENQESVENENYSD
jgi:hypothetical protein